MTEHYILYKSLAEFDDGEHNPYFERGVFPVGEVMGIFDEKEAAEQRKEFLESISPSERFGETMDEAPYDFWIQPRTTNPDLYELNEQ